MPGRGPWRPEVAEGGEKRNVVLCVRYAVHDLVHALVMRNFSEMDRD